MSFLLNALPGSSTLWRIGMYALVGLLLIGFGYFKGNEHGTAKLIEYQGKQAAEGVKIATRQGEVTVRVLTNYVKVAGETKTKTETIEKEVIRYETLKLDACPVSNAWIGLHDAAAANKIPDTTRSTDGTASGITAGEALGTVTGNYSRFHETADRLRALQDWIRQQQAVTPDAPKKWWQR